MAGTSTITDQYLIETKIVDQTAAGGASPERNLERVEQAGRLPLVSEWLTHATDQSEKE